LYDSKAGAQANITQGKVGPSETNGTVVFFDLFKKLKMLKYKVFMVI